MMNGNSNIKYSEIFGSYTHSRAKPIKCTVWANGEAQVIMSHLVVCIITSVP